MIPFLAKDMRVLVVDDEASARRRLVELVSPSVAEGCLFEAEDGLSAVESIVSIKPDLVFLDIQMPELNGLEVVEAVGALNMPITVFVTAHDRHAIRAFEANALDYLLKPFSDERFEAAFVRAKARIDERNIFSFGQSMLRILATNATPELFLDRLVVRSSGTTRLIRVAEIESIEGAGEQVTLHVGGKELLHRATLKELSLSLDPVQFIRVHRSTIVNVDGIVRLESLSHGEFEMTLKSGRQVRVSRTYRPVLESRFKQAL